jgi:mono/diheme cytochrome c family protein
MLALATAGLLSPVLAQLKPEPPKLKGVDMTGDAAAGEKVYLSSCWTCHGLAGDGKGPAAAGMKPPPTDFTQAAALKEKSSGEIYDAILKGKPASAMYPQPLEPQSVVNVAAYLRTLARDPAQERKLLDGLTRGDREAGRVLYNARCWTCHGPTGRGNGPASPALKPPPADFTDPDQVTARTGARLYRAITSGVPGTAMAPQSLSEREKFDLIAYLRSLVRYADQKGDVAGEAEEGAADHGKEIYEKRCWSCHGMKGEGDGPAATAMIPAPTRFADYEKMKNRPAADWFSAIQDGVPGTAMYAQRLTEKEAWDLIAYLRTLGRRGAPPP